MSDMQGVEGVTVGIKTMSDSTLRITIDIPPYKAKEAFNLFGEKGTTVAVAALNLSQYRNIVEEDNQLPEQKEVPERIPATMYNPSETLEDQFKNDERAVHAEQADHTLSRLAAMFCQNEDFWEFLNGFQQAIVVLNKDDAKEYIYAYCKIKSRATLDDPLRPDAIYQFHVIRKAFSQWNDQMTQ